MKKIISLRGKVDMEKVDKSGYGKRE